MDLRKTVPSQGFTKGAAKESVDTMLWKKGGGCNEDVCEPRMEGLKLALASRRKEPRKPPE